MIGFKEQRFAKFFTPIRQGAAQKKRKATATATRATVNSSLEFLSHIF